MLVVALVREAGCSCSDEETALLESKKQRL